MADSSESERENYNISSSTDEEDLFGTIGRRFQPYQDEPLASSDSGLLQMGMTIPEMRMGYGRHSLETEKLDRFLSIIAVSACHKRKVVAALLTLELIDDDNEGKGHKKRKMKAWMKRRDGQGYANNIVRELSMEDTNGFKEMMRMSYEDFLYILNLIEKDIMPKQILGGQKQPPDAGSHYYNYKHTHSIVLLAVAGPDYECVYADIGTNGRVSDGGVWNKCSLSRGIESGKICLPGPKNLPLGVEKVPYVFVGDDAFALKPYLMKPYPQCGLTNDKRIYNYRHSRARRISENLFGIIANRWRVFRSVILLPPESISTITMATLTIHNFLRKSQSRKIYCPVGMTDAVDLDGGLSPGMWCNDQATNNLISLPPPPRGHNACTNAKKVRDMFKDYFCNEGAVEWQWNKC
eukprot:gene5764-11043_t